MAQPDIPALLAGMNVVTAGLNSVANEVSCIPNIPALAGGAQIQATLATIQASLNALTNTVNNNGVAINALTNTVNATQVALNALTNTVHNNQAALNALTNDVNNNHAATQQTLAQIQAYIANGPMRATNAGAGNTGPLCGPAGLIPAVQVHTRDRLMVATGAECDALQAFLGRPNFPAGTQVAQKCTSLADFLGCAIL
ncbi:hypothetical protein BJ165DRAFT_1530081 [Panaeolus papilionaceus]|nr:hypothetical protein BJ165DRAFT_1530081 [Panaeolus papilionaceus]